MKTSTIHSTAALLIALCLSVGQAHAALSLAINEINSNRFSATISGSFDSNVIGDQKQWLAIKADWLLNNGTNVDWIADSVVLGALNTRPGVTVVEDTITFSGYTIADRLMAGTNADQAVSWGDSIYYAVNGNLTAGTSVSGTITIDGAGLFDFANISSLQLVSGFDNSQQEWKRLEATAVVPEPSVLCLGLMAVVAMLARRCRLSA